MGDTIRLKGVIIEDFSNYKLPSLFLAFAFCDFKCCHDIGLDEGACQNSPLAKQKVKEFNIESIIKAYTENSITKAVVIGGLEPLLQYEELVSFIKAFRAVSSDTIIIYTGYNKEEIIDKIKSLAEFSNIIFKYGRYIPGDMPHLDKVLGVSLASDNQYAEVLC